MPGLARYARVISVPHARPLMIASLLARVPIGIHALAIILFARHATGSYATAGALSAAFAVGAGLGGPVIGRLVDLRGQRAVLLPIACVHAAALLTFVALLLAGAAAVLAGIAGTIAGLCVPPMSSIMRSMWPALLEREPKLLSTAFALESVLVETVFVVGPLLVALSVVIASPQVALIGAAAMTMAGTLWFVSHPASRERGPAPGAGDHGLAGALRSRGIRVLMISLLPVGFTLGALEVAVPAFADDRGHRALAGLLLATWSVASATGGFWYGAREHVRPMAERYLRLALIFPLAHVALVLEPPLGLMFVLLVPAGLAIAPLLTASSELAGALAPVGAETEGYTWPMTSLIGGLAAGSLAAGALAEGPGWPAAFLAALVGAAVAATAAFAGRGALSGTAPGR